jgi:phage protein D
MPSRSASPRPGYRITLGGRNITPALDGRLEQLTLTDRRGMEADQLDLTLSDHDGRLALPRTGVELSVAIGWQDEGLVDRGTFIVDEVEHSGTPDVLRIGARSADLRGNLAAKRTESWHRVSIDAVVRSIASRHTLKPLVGEQLAGVRLEHIDQTNESDISFLSRLAERFDAIATVKAGRLLFIPAGEGATATGLPIPAITITRGDGDRHRYTETDRNQYSGVRAHWQDIAGAERREIIVGEADNLKTLRQTYGRETDARAAAESEWKRIGRGAAALSLTLARGRADIYPETPVRIRGFKRDMDEQHWLIKDVRHNLSDRGYNTSIKCETVSEAEG